MNLLRRLRGAAGTAAVWGVVWACAGIVWAIVTPGEDGHWHTRSMPIGSAADWALPGTIGGLVFALLLANDGRHRIDQLTMKRAGFWGAVSGVLLPLSMEIGRSLVAKGAFSSWAIELVVEFALVGGACGAGMLAIARGAQRGGTDFLADDVEVHEQLKESQLLERNLRIEHAAGIAITNDTRIS